jgi:DNA primase
MENNVIEVYPGASKVPTPKTPEPLPQGVMWKLPSNGPIAQEEGGDRPEIAPEYEEMFLENSKLLRAQLKERGYEGPLFDMEVERLNSLYAFIRHTEATTGYKHERNHKEINQLWQSFADGVRKLITAEDEAMLKRRIEHEATEQLSKLITSALENMPKELESVATPYLIAALEARR